MENCVKRGEVIWVRLKGEGSVQRGLRPSIVIQNNVGNKYSPTIIVVPMTTYRGKRLLPTQVKVKKENFEGATYKDSIALTEQLRVVDKKDIVKRSRETLPNEIINEIDAAISISLGLSV